MARAVIEVVVRHELSPESLAALQHILRPVLAGLTRLENRMSETSEFLSAELPKLDTVLAGLADISDDVAVLLTKASSSGVFTPEERDRADAVTGKLDAVHTALSNLNDQVGDQNLSDAPQPTGGGDESGGTEG